MQCNCNHIVDFVQSLIYRSCDDFKGDYVVKCRLSRRHLMGLSCYLALFKDLKEAILFHPSGPQRKILKHSHNSNPKRVHQQ